MAVRKAGADRIFWGSFAAAVALIAPGCFDAIVETDAGFHVIVGRDILRGSLPHINGHSWIAHDQPWFSTYWLFDAVCAALDGWLGPLGLQLLTLAMGAGTLFLCGKLLARGGRLGPLLLPAIALLLDSRLRPRPHCATWIAIGAVILAGLDARERGPLLRWLALIPIALDTNLHAGAAFASALLGLFFFEAFLRSRKKLELLGVAAAPAALLLNPNGWLNVRYLFAHLDVDSLVPLREFAAPSWPASAAFFAVWAIALAVGLRAPKRSGAVLAGVMIFGALGIFAARMQYELFIVATPLLGEAVELVTAKFGKRAAAMAAFSALTLCVLQVDYVVRLAVLDLGPKYDAAVLPVRAARYVQDHGLEGHYFNSYDDGGYLMYALPDQPVFLDGRLHAYPASLYAKLREGEKSPSAFDAFLRSSGVEWAIVQRRSAITTGDKLLDAQPGWALVYWDDINEIFVRRDIPRFSALVAGEELHFLWPTGIHQGPAASVRAEADRLLRYSPRDPLLLSARAIASR
jgi:hypothetical protein